jgi:hypothetical protein
MNGNVRFLEIKNPQNSYGRRGPNANQRKFAENWNGERPIIVFGIADALAAAGIRP